MPPIREIKVFIASLGDLVIERRAFKDTIDSLNAGFGRGADIKFIPLGWEIVHSQVGRRSQSVINQSLHPNIVAHDHTQQNRPNLKTTILQSIIYHQPIPTA